MKEIRKIKTNDIRVIIAEDEPIILNNIVKKITSASDFIRVTGMALSGRETLELMSQETPDILITDIEMPGMNGLELIREVRSRYPQVHILILSGYSNFEYARTALQYGIDDYLLKPVSSEELSTVLTKITDSILVENHQSVRNILSKTLQGEVLDSASPSFFQDGNFLLVFLTLGNLISCHTELLNIKDISLLWEEIDFNEVVLADSVDHIWVIDELCPLQKFVIFHTVTGNIHINAIVSRLFSYILSRSQQLPFYIMAQDTLIPYSEIGEHARKMRLALPLYAKPFRQEIILYPGFKPCPSLEPQKKKEQHDFFYQLTTISAFLQYADSLVLEYIKKDYSEHTLENLFDEMFQALPILFQINETVCIQAKTAVLQKIYSFQSWDKIFPYIKETILLLFDNQDSSIGSDNICPKIKQYIVQNYNRHISMEDLSAAYGYTASYINRLFKKDCGSSPLQFQTGLRMDKAKELLASQPDMDIKIIAAAIGYEDARYFSRVFKNEIGMTPSEFLAKIQSSASKKM